MSTSRFAAFVKPLLILVALALVAGFALGALYVAMYRGGDAETAAYTFAAAVLLVLAALPICGWALIKHANLLRRLVGVMAVSLVAAIVFVYVSSRVVATVTG